MSPEEIFVSGLLFQGGRKEEKQDKTAADIDILPDLISKANTQNVWRKSLHLLYILFSYF